MDRFAIITHPLDKSELADVAKLIPTFLISKMLRICPPYKKSEITGVASRYNRVSGCEVFCPVTYDILENNSGQPWVLKKLVAACRIAKKQDAKIVGLCSSLPLIPGLAEKLTQVLNIPVTSGNGYRVFAAVEAIKIAVQTKGLHIDKCKTVVIGALGHVGSVISAVLAGEVRDMVLVDNDERMLEHLAGRIVYDTGLVSKISTKADTVLKDADIIVMADNDTFSGQIKFDDLKEGTIVCDLFRTTNLTEANNKRNDLVLINKILSEVPGDLKFNGTETHRGLIDSGMAEVLLLALEKRYNLCRNGSRISLPKINEVSMLARKHGFKVTGFLTKSDAGGIKNNLSGKIILSGNV